jgi:hypothetical protein
MAIAVRRTPLDKTLMYLSCARKKLKKSGPDSGALALLPHRLHGIELRKEITRLTFFAGKVPSECLGEPESNSDSGGVRSAAARLTLRIRVRRPSHVTVANLKVLSPGSRRQTPTAYY